MELVGVAAVSDYRIHVAVQRGYPAYASTAESRGGMEAAGGPVARSLEDLLAGVDVVVNCTLKRADGAHAHAAGGGGSPRSTGPRAPAGKLHRPHPVAGACVNPTAGRGASARKLRVLAASGDSVGHLSHAVVLDAPARRCELESAPGLKDAASPCSASEPGWGQPEVFAWRSAVHYAASIARGTLRAARETLGLLRDFRPKGSPGGTAPPARA